MNEEEILRRAGIGTPSGAPDPRVHYLKMGAAALVMLLSFGLFACGILGGKQVEDRVKAVKVSGPATARAAQVSGPEMTALVAGCAASVYFLFLVLRLRRLR